MRRGEIDLADSDATVALGAALGAVVRIGDVIALSGQLGAGKTTFARGVLAGLGFDAEAPSPSFPIVIAYAPPEVRVPFWHVDLYRIEDGGDLAELGLDDALIDAALAIEWPERLSDTLSPDALCLSFEPVGQGRRLTWAAPTAWDGRWPAPSR